MMARRGAGSPCSRWPSVRLRALAAGQPLRPTRLRSRAARTGSAATRAAAATLDGGVNLLCGNGVVDRGRGRGLRAWRAPRQDLSVALVSRRASSAAAATAAPSILALPGLRRYLVHRSGRNLQHGLAGQRALPRGERHQGDPAPGHPHPRVPDAAWRAHPLLLAAGGDHGSLHGEVRPGLSGGDGELAHGRRGLQLDERGRGPEALLHLHAQGQRGGLHGAERVRRREDLLLSRLPPAHRGRVGARLPRGHQHGLLRRGEQPAACSSDQVVDASLDCRSAGTGPTPPAGRTRGRKQPNAWGLFDLAGNVAEWCHDYFQNDLGSAAGRRPGRPGDGGAPTRVLRGGSWDSPAQELRAAARAPSRHRRSSRIGFRCVRTLGL